VGGVRGDERAAGAGEEDIAQAPVDGVREELLDGGPLVQGRPQLVGEVGLDRLEWQLLGHAGSVHVLRTLSSLWW
jgi:hypothetical protein